MKNPIYMYGGSEVMAKVKVLICAHTRQHVRRYRGMSYENSSADIGPGELKRSSINFQGQRQRVLANLKLRM